MAARSLVDVLRGIAKGLLAPHTRRSLRHLQWCWHMRRQVAALGADRWRFVALPVWLGIRRSLAGRDPVEAFTLRAPGVPHPLRLRYGTSDLEVFGQIFVEQEYGFLAGQRDVRRVVDCGANVGFASVWMLTRFPEARVVAVEPDPENVEAARANLAPYGDRVTPVPGAVWSSVARLRVVRGEFGDGRHWATTVREARDDEPHDLLATDLPTLFAQVGGAPIDVLKVDIEGSETVVFADPSRPWEGRVRALAIELHSPEAEAVVGRAFPPEAFARCCSGELTGFVRREDGEPSVATPVAVDRRAPAPADAYRVRAPEALDRATGAEA